MVNMNTSSLVWLLIFLVITIQGQTLTTNNAIVLLDEEVVWNPSLDISGTIDQTTSMTDLVDYQNQLNSTNQTAHEPGCNELPTEEEYLECLRTFAFKIDTMEWILIFCHSVVFITGLVCMVYSFTFSFCIVVPIHTSY